MMKLIEMKCEDCGETSTHRCTFCNHLTCTICAIMLHSYTRCEKIIKLDSV